MSRALPRPTTCPKSGKKRWPDHKSAVAVLHKASNSRKFSALEGMQSERSEVQAYICDSCGGWHTTSKLTWDSRVVA